MARIRRAHVAHFLILAASCSAGDPSTDGDVRGVLGVDILKCSNGQNCVIENISSVAISNGVAIIARNYQSDPNSTNLSLRIESANFEDGGIQTIAEDTFASQGEVVAGNAGAFYYATVDGQPQQSLALHAAGTASDAGTFPLSGKQNIQGSPTGIVIDGNAVIFGVTQMGSGGGCDTCGPDTEFWLNATNTTTTPHDVRTGDLVRVDTTNGQVTTLFANTGSTTFEATYSRHLLVADATNVYWVAGPSPGTVMKATKDFSSAAQTLASVGQGYSASGLATFGTVVAWATTTDLVVGPPGCWVYANGTPVLTTTAFSCLGLAIDAQYAYFAIVARTSVQQNSSDGGTFTQPYVAGTALARVSLAGPPNQVPSQISVASTRYYGPRRVLADTDFVYAVDPAYVIRVPKTAFK